MQITAVDSQELLECATIGLFAHSTPSDHWLSCPFEDSWHISSDGNSSGDAFFCFHNGFIHQLLHVPPEVRNLDTWGQWLGWPGHRATYSRPIHRFPNMALRWFLIAMLKWAGDISIHRPVYQMHVSHFSMHKPVHVHCCCHKAVMIATDSVCFQAHLRAVLNVSTHSLSATPT